MATFDLHIPDNSWVWINEVGIDFDDTYIFLVDSLGNVVFEDDDSPMGTSSIFYGFIAAGGTYTIQATTFNAGQTGTIRVRAGCEAEIAWCSAAGQSINFNATNLTLPITWQFFGTLPSGIVGSVGFDTSFFNLNGITTERGLFPVSFIATDFAGKITNGSAVLKLLGLSFPTENTVSIFPNPTPLPYVVQKGVAQTITLAPTGGTPPYTLTLVNPLGMPGGLTYDPSTFTISGTPDGTNTPASAGFLLTDSVGDHCGPTLQFCTTSNGPNIGADVWETPDILTNHPPFDSVTIDAMAGGDFEFHLSSTYNGLGPCGDAEAALTVFVALCYGKGNPKSAQPYPITLTVDVNGIMGNSPACVTEGDVIWRRTWDMPIYFYSNAGTLNTPYSDHQEWTLNEPITHGSCCTIIQMDFVVRSATMHVVGTIRPLTQP